jgi:hypothetical protein
MSQKVYRRLWNKDIKKNHVSTKQPSSRPTHAADGGRTAPTDARHVTRLKGAIVSCRAICEREQVYRQRLIGCAALALPGRAVKVASEPVSAAVRPRPALESLSAGARIIVLHRDLYYYYYRIASPAAAAIPISGRAAATSNALPRRETIVLPAAVARRRRSLSDTHSLTSHRSFETLGRRPSHQPK